MRRRHLVGVVVLAAAALGYSVAQTQKGPTTVNLYVRTLDEHRKACEQGGYGPHDVLVIQAGGAHPKPVVEHMPFSCVRRSFFRHGTTELAQETVVHVSRSRNDSVRWVSTVPFSVESIVPYDKSAPENPFENFKPSSGTANEHITGRITEAAGKFFFYKVTFRIAGQLVDPDLVGEP